MLSESNSLTQKDGNLKRKLDALDHGGATKKAKADKKAPTPVKELVWPAWKISNANDCRSMTVGSRSHE